MTCTWLAPGEAAGCLPRLEVAAEAAVLAQRDASRWWGPASPGGGASGLAPHWRSAYWLAAVATSLLEAQAALEHRCAHSQRPACCAALRIADPGWLRQEGGERGRRGRR
jgi:hypothetical protein